MTVQYIELPDGWLAESLEEIRIRMDLEILNAQKKYLKRSLIKVEKLIKEYEEKESKL